jgi:hypothetical protein
MNGSEKCGYCGVTNTTNRDEQGKPQCVSCSNEQYCNDLKSGRRIELKIDTLKVRPETLAKIYDLIQNDTPVSIEPTPNKEGKAGLDYIRDERHRQIYVEGFNPESDLIYHDGQLAFAAATYALPEAVNNSRTFKRIHLWPWASQWWKPSINDRIKELAKAGALIAAEIDRLLKVK